MWAKMVNQLNKQQKEAVSYILGPSIILAGAGSGKTRVLVCKVLNLIKNHQVNPLSIVMITFTNKAAGEMKDRVYRYGKLGYIGTFHSFCAKILRQEGYLIGLDNKFTIYDENDQLNLIKNILKKKDFNKFTPSYYLSRISTAKNQLISPEKFLEIFSDHQAAHIADVYFKYQKELKRNKAVDFDDLIMLVVQLFSKNKEISEKYQNKYRYLLVDEFQDTNYAQYALTRLLGKKYANVTVVGDFSQSIYSWRGAEIKNLEKFKEDFPGTKLFYLEENYRSTQKILDFAYKVISKNQTHPILNLFTQKEHGEDITLYEVTNEEEEAIFISSEVEKLNEKIPYISIAVLYRTNAQSRIIEEAFLHFGIPYVLIGGTRFYERKEIKDVLSYLRLFVNPNDEIAKERIKKLGKKRWEDFKKFYKKFSIEAKKVATVDLIEKIFQETNYLQLYNIDDEEDYSRLENIKELKSVALNFPDLSEFLEQVALVEAEYFEGEKKNKNMDGVRLMTLHQAKGLEFSVVFITGVEEGILPHSRSVDDYFQLEEERRLFYVGITRAKEKLYITYTKRRFIFGRRTETIKSRFIEEEIDEL